MKAESHVLSIDGLRGFAVALVLVFHFFIADFTAPQHAGVRAVFKHLAEMGWIGVDLFFVLSGFLITTILLKSHRAVNYYGVFYARRALRILPVYLLALAVVFFALIPFEHLHVARGEQVWYWLNISNLRSAFYPLAVPFVTHFWTLSVEEQFYTVWPTVVRSATPRRVLWISVAGVLLSPVMRNLPVVQHINASYPNFIYRFTVFHVDGLFCGAGLSALYLTHAHSKRLANAARGLFGFALALTCLLSLWPNPQLPPMTRFGYSVIVLLWGSLLWLCISPEGVPRFREFFESWPLRRLGLYSYSIYIWQVVVRDAIYGRAVKVFAGFAHAHHTLFTVLVRLISLCVLYIVAALSWRFLEEPILRYKRHFRYRIAHQEDEGESDPKTTEWSTHSSQWEARRGNAA